MDFYSDLDLFFKHNYAQYWDSGALKVAFYEPDFKNLDNMIQQMNSFNQPGYVPHIKLLSSNKDFCDYTDIHMCED